MVDSRKTRRCLGTKYTAADDASRVEPFDNYSVRKTRIPIGSQANLRSRTNRWQLIFIQCLGSAVLKVCAAEETFSPIN
jgi:hypothetical protein